MTINQMREELEISDIPMDRLEQICQAEQEGRVHIAPNNKINPVWFPCEVGDTVNVISRCENVLTHMDNDYFNGTGAVECPFESTCDTDNCNDEHVRIFETYATGFLVEENNVTIFLKNICFNENAFIFGQTVFLTIEEAEAALKGAIQDGQQRD